MDMLDVTPREKPDVLNPLTFRNTVGAELADIFEAHNVEGYEGILGVEGLRGKERLSKKVMRRAAETLNVPGVDIAQLLGDFQRVYLEEKPRYVASFRKAKRAYSKLKRVVPLMRGEFTDGCDRLDDILDFFDANKEEDVFTWAEKAAALFRKQNNVAVDPINLSAWLRRGELDFHKMKAADYDKGALLSWIDGGEWMGDVEKPEYFKALPQTLSRFGVGLALVPSLPKTVYGAVRWLDGRPLVQVSDRGQDLATCWFTLFHELGHVALHRDAEIFEGGMNDFKTAPDRREREANEFASRYLFNGDELRRAVFERKKSGRDMNANALAEEFKVRPLFTSYWLLKAQYRPAFQRRVHIDFTEQYQ